MWEFYNTIKMKWVSFFVGRDLKEKDLLHQCIVKFTIHGTENGRCYNK